MAIYLRGQVCEHWTFPNSAGQFAIGAERILKIFIRAVLCCLLTFFIIDGGSAAAWADSCSDVIPGARPGPDVPEGRFNHAFKLDYDDACFVQWPGNNRGAAGRAEDEAKCHRLAGDGFLEFEPDGGSNFNLCVFRPGSSSGSGDDEPSLPDTQRRTEAPRASSSSASQKPPGSAGDTSVTNYGTVEFCNKSGESPLWLAQIYHESSSAWMIEGWWSFANGECKSFRRPIGNYTSGWVYYHAQTKEHTWWLKGPTGNFCVEPTAFKRTTTQVCAERFKVTGFGRTLINKDQTTVVEIKGPQPAPSSALRTSQLPDMDSVKPSGFKNAECSEEPTGSLFTTGPIEYSCKHNELAHLQRPPMTTKRFVAIACGRSDSDMMARHNASSRAKDAVFKLEIDEATKMGANRDRNEIFITDKVELNCVRTK